MGPVLTQQCLADCCRDIKENGRFVFVHITLSCDIQAVRVCVLRWGGGFSSMQFLESSCTCPVCQQRGLEQTLKKRGGFHTTGLTGAAYFPKTTMTTLLFCAAELLGSMGLAPGLWGLEIISRLSPPHMSLLDFLASPCFQGSKVSRMLFWLSVLHIETGSPVGVVRRLQGGSKEVRETLSVYFLSLALGNMHHKSFCIFLASLLVFCLCIHRRR